MPAKQVAAWQCKKCEKLFPNRPDADKHQCKPTIKKVSIPASELCKIYRHDWRVESAEVVRQEEWDEPDADSLFNPNRAGLVTNFAPVYKIKVVCNCCGETKYTEKTCYNQEEIPKIGQEVLLEAG